MTKTTFTIPGISCGHCVTAIQNELGELDGVKAVDGDPASKTISVEFESPATPSKISELLKEINYPAADILS